ncbi:MAG: hypothetical protein WB626_06205 [Bacteroidota bacterium]
MPIVLTVALIIALLSLSAVCIYLLLLLTRVREILGTAEKDMRELMARAVPVLENMEFVTARLKSISESIDDQVMMIRDSVGSVREVADNIVALERKVQQSMEGPILETVAFVAAVLKGVRAFLHRVRAV